MVIFHSYVSLPEGIYIYISYSHYFWGMTIPQHGSNPTVDHGMMTMAKEPPAEVVEVANVVVENPSPLLGAMDADPSH